MHSKNVQTAITHLFDAYNARDLDLATAGYSSDIVFINRTRGTTITGVDDVRAMFAKGMSSPNPARAEIDEIFDAGDTVVFTFTMHTIDPESGQKLTAPWCDIVKFNAAGQIIYEDNYNGKSEPAV
jgi:hypothetical protein